MRAPVAVGRANPVRNVGRVLRRNSFIEPQTRQNFSRVQKDPPYVLVFHRAADPAVEPDFDYTRANKL